MSLHTFPIFLRCDDFMKAQKPTDLYGSISVCLNIRLSTYPVRQHVALHKKKKNGLLRSGRRRNIISRLLNGALPTGGGGRGKQTKVCLFRRAGRKCFPFQSVLYPLVINKGSREKEDKLLGKMKRFCSAPGAGSYLLPR